MGETEGVSVAASNTPPILRGDQIFESRAIALRPREYALNVLEAAGFLKQSGKNRKTIVCDLNKFRAKSLDWESLRTLLGPYATREHGDTSEISVMYRIFEGLKVYAKTDKKWKVTGEAIPLFPEFQDVHQARSANFAKKIKYHLGPWELPTTKYPEFYPVKDPKAGQTNFNEVRINLEIYKYGAYRKPGQPLMIVFSPGQKHKPISSEFFTDVRGFAAACEVNGHEYSLNRPVEYFYLGPGRKLTVLEGGFIDPIVDFKVTSGSATEKIFNIPRILNKKGEVTVQGTKSRYRFGREYGSGRYQAMRLSDKLGAIINTDINHRRHIAVIFELNPKDVPNNVSINYSKGKRFKDVHKHAISIYKGKADIVSNYADLRTVYDHFDEFFNFSLLCSADAKFKLANLPISLQAEAFNLYKQYGQDKKFWAILSAHGQNGLKTLLLAHRSQGNINQIFEAGDYRLSGGLIVEAASIFDLLEKNLAQIKNKLPPDKWKEAEAMLDFVSTHTNVILSAGLKGCIKDNTEDINKAISEIRAYRNRMAKAFQTPKYSLLQALSLDNVSELPLRDQIVAYYMDKIYENRGQYTYRLVNKFAKPTTQIDYILLDLYLEKETAGSIIKYLTMAKDEDKLRTILGIVVDRWSLSWTLNTLRDVINNPDSRVLRSELDAVGRVAMGFRMSDTSKDFAASIAEFYQRVNLGQLEHLQAANETDLKLFQQIIEESRQSGKLNLTQEKKLVQGCGEGRDSNALANLGVEKIIGIDISPYLIERARAVATKTPVEYCVGDWRDMKKSKPPIRDHSIGLIINTGRNLHHSFDLKLVVEEMARVLKPGGEVLFDMADNNTGLYLLNRQKTLKLYRDWLHIPFARLGDETKQLSHIETVIDCPRPNDPAESNFLERSAYHQQTIFRIFRNAGFDIKEYYRDEIQGWKGAQNVYYKAVYRGY